MNCFRRLVGSIPVSSEARGAFVQRSVNYSMWASLLDLLTLMLIIVAEGTPKWHTCARPPCHDNRRYAQILYNYSVFTLRRSDESSLFALERGVEQNFGRWDHGVTFCVIIMSASFPPSVMSELFCAWESPTMCISWDRSGRLLLITKYLQPSRFWLMIADVCGKASKTRSLVSKMFNREWVGSNLFHSFLYLNVIIITV